jgi:hypothetical protein
MPQTVAKTREPGRCWKWLLLIGMSSISWRPHFEQLEREGEHFPNCIAACERNTGVYGIPPPPPRHSGRESKPTMEKQIILCSATLAIIPPNLYRSTYGCPNIYTSQGRAQKLNVQTCPPP